MRWLLFLLCAVTPLQAQDTIRIKHRNYETVFSKSKNYPVLVEWWVTKTNISCKNPTKRSDKFLADPLLGNTDLHRDYVSSGFDRGHLSPAADNACLGKIVMDESFFYTNMAPQYPGLNRGQWKALEDHVRELSKSVDSIFVQAGCVGESSKIKTISVPTHCWKVFKVKRTGETFAYVFPNIPQRSTSFNVHKVSLDSITNLRK